VRAAFRHGGKRMRHEDVVFAASRSGKHEESLMKQKELAEIEKAARNKSKNVLLSEFTRFAL
jgi:hypothetical protein